MTCQRRLLRQLLTCKSRRPRILKARLRRLLLALQLNFRVWIGP